MAIAKVSEITSTSKTSFEDAVASGIERAGKTIHGITGAWVAVRKLAADRLRPRPRVRASPTAPV